MLFVLVSFALGEIAATYTNIGIKGFILVSIFLCILDMCLLKKKFLLMLLIGIIIFGISYFNTREYNEEILNWKKTKENKDITVVGYIDDIIKKENVVYIYIDECFILADMDVYTDLYIGNYVEIRGKTKHFEKARNEGNFDEEKYYNSLGFISKIEAVEISVIDKEKDKLKVITGTIKNKYITSIYKIWDKETADIITAITVGFKENLSDDIKERYRVIGISHVLAISGLHLSIMGMGIFNLLRKRFGYFISGVGGILVILLFGVMVGDSASIHRATIMFIMHIIALMLGRTYDMISSTSVAAVMLMYNCPYVVYNAGFILSFGAITAICIISNIFEKANAFTVAGAIQSITLPLTMQLYYEIPLYGLFVNLIVIPTVGVLIVSGFLSGILGMFSMELGYFVSGIGKIILWFYDKIYDVVSIFPYNNIVTGKSKIWLMVVYYAFLVGIMVIIYHKKRQSFMLIAIPMVVMFLLLNRDTSFYFSSIDVGQGDCLLVHNKGNSVYMIDAGSSDVSGIYGYRIKSTLKAKGIEKINGFIVTHTDIDHISAVKEMIDDDLIECIYLPDIGQKNEGYSELQEYAIECGIDVKYISSGMALNSGKMTMKCLYPYKNIATQDINETSTVIKIEYAGNSILCMGDLGIEGEKNMLTMYDKDELDCDVLKVGHHGSKYSSCIEFLKIVSPKVAVISCGEDNSYGHPHKETLDRLKEVGSKILMTKDRGEVVLGMEGEGG